MSKINPLILLLFLTALIYSCSDNESEIENGKPEKVTFNFSPSNRDITSGRVTANKLPAGTSLLISLTDNAGNSILTHHRINILHFGESYTTEPLELAPGRYNLTDFMVVNDSSDVLFATPQQNAPLSKIVNHALPYSFVVSRNKVLNVEMEVVNVHQHMPQDFGYVAFNINVVTPLSISVFTSNNNGLKFTDAKAFILKGTDTLSAYHLAAKINVLPVEHNTDDTCTLVIIKDGYARYTKSFVPNDLLTELNNRPLTVNLVPALTLNLRYQYIPGGERLVTFDVSLREPGEIIANWGDGTQELIQLYHDDGTNDYYADLSHVFPVGSSDYFVSITGAIDKITGFTTDYNEYQLNPLNVTALTALKSVDLFISGTNGLLDLRQNKNLESLTLNADSVLLPASNHLRYVRLFEQLASSVDYFIDNVYENATSKGIYNGKFDFSDYAYDSEEDELHDPISEPSESSRIKLKSLYDDYQWKVFPISYR